jgi:hypothetical protein
LNGLIADRLFIVYQGRCSHLPLHSLLPLPDSEQQLPDSFILQLLQQPPSFSQVADLQQSFLPPFLQQGLLPLHLPSFTQQALPELALVLPLRSY